VKIRKTTALGRFRLASERDFYVAGKTAGPDDSAKLKSGSGLNKRTITMLKSTYTTRLSGASPLRVVSGSQITRWRLTKHERAQLAGMIMDEVVFVGKLNQRQVADLCKVSLAYARKMRRPQIASQLQAAE
jgi:hypothetical protein